MDSNVNEVYFNFSYYALNLLGKQMYSSKWNAISELVANGLDAGAKTVRVYINSIEKNKSTIEIFDDGSGMSYSDLINKYALIGRNKREEDNNLSDKIKGRKGVGKLAGLYLSKKYYIVTKKDGVESSWILDSTSAKDSDIPKLDKINNEDVKIDNQHIWKNYKKGTLIKLTDVDMSNFAEKRLDGLKRRISDYYLLDELVAHHLRQPQGGQLRRHRNPRCARPAPAGGGAGARRHFADGLLPPGDGQRPAAHRRSLLGTDRRLGRGARLPDPGWPVGLLPRHHREAPRHRIGTQERATLPQPVPAGRRQHPDHRPRAAHHRRQRARLRPLRL